MNGFIWLMRMARWARRPPSAGRVLLVAGVVAVCLGLYAVDRLVGWPAWLTPNRVPHARILR